VASSSSDELLRLVKHAHEEALALSHVYLGTEHMLLALLRETDGVAADVLKAFSADVTKTRQVVLGVLKKGTASPPVGANLPYTSRGKKTMELAMWQAREWHHDSIGPEHVLIGLLREKGGIGAQVLMDAGVTLDVALAHTLSIVGKQR
jgi:ATP-dependent Clp protease ATP-binding subunit ClpC